GQGTSACVASSPSPGHSLPPQTPPPAPITAPTTPHTETSHDRHATPPHRTSFMADLPEVNPLIATGASPPPVGEADGPQVSAVPLPQLPQALLRHPQRIAHLRLFPGRRAVGLVAHHLAVAAPHH